MEQLMEMMMQMLVIFLAIIVIVYIVTGIVLTILNKLMYGKGTPMAWIPVFSTYLLGKLTVNKLFGWVLVIGIFITGNYTTTVNGVEKNIYYFA